MARILKAFVIAVAAVLALSAATAPSSPAATAKFTAAEYPAFVHGEQSEARHQFVYGSRIISCNTVTFEGTLEAATSDFKVTPTYATCHSFVIGSTFTITVTQSTPCELEFHMLTEPKEFVEGSVDIECEFILHAYLTHADYTANKPMCALHITPTGNQGLKEIVYSNMAGPPKDITLDTNVPVTVTRTGSSLCGAAHATGTYKGRSTLIAENIFDEQINLDVG